ncbi:hypothetical protein ACFL0Q_09395 [Thermodesulfobacteriota bacterium]
MKRRVLHSVIDYVYNWSDLEVASRKVVGNRLYIPKPGTKKQRSLGIPKASPKCPGCQKPGVLSGITYTTREKVVDLGPIQVTADKTRTLLLVVGGKPDLAASKK